MQEPRAIYNNFGDIHAIKKQNIIKQMDIDFIEYLLKKKNYLKFLRKYKDYILESKYYLKILNIMIFSKKIYVKHIFFTFKYYDNINKLNNDKLINKFIDNGITIHDINYLLKTINYLNVDYIILTKKLVFNYYYRLLSNSNSFKIFPIEILKYIISFIVLEYIKK